MINFIHDFSRTLRANWQLLSFGFLLQFFSIGGQTVFISLFGGYLRQDLSLSHSEFGGYYSMATFASALLLTYTGQFSDRIDLKKMTTLITLLLAISCTIMAFTHTVWLLILSFFLLRHLGQGLFSLVGITAVMRYIEKNRGTANSLARMGYSVAEGLMPVIVVALLLIMQWWHIWLFMAALLLLFMLPLSYYLLKDHPQRHQHYLNKINQTQASFDDEVNVFSASQQYSRRQVVRDPTFYLILPCLLSAPMLFTGFIFHQIQLLTEKGWELSWWSGVLLVYSITGIISLLSGGLLIDRFTARKILTLIPITLGIGLAVLSYATAPQMAILAIVVISFSGSLSSAISAPLFVELYGTKHLGSIKSLSTSFMVFATSVSPFIIGFFLDQGIAFNTILLGGSVYCVCAWLLLLTKTTTKKPLSPLNERGL